MTPRRRPSSRRKWPARWRRHPLAFAATLVLLILLIWSRLDLPAGTGNDYDRYHNRTFTCVNVVDGDTFDINIPDREHDTTRIRLWGVDTPETSGSPRGQMYFGDEAKAFTRGHVLHQQVRVVLAPHKTRGRYGRLLAYVYLGDSDVMLNEELLREGYAYADRRFDHPSKESFIQQENRARSRRAGLWESVTVDQMPAWRQHDESPVASP